MQSILHMLRWTCKGYVTYVEKEVFIVRYVR